ncbi:MAG: DUF669 domain-containing protein [Coprobacillaceae bacterium]
MIDLVSMAADIKENGYVDEFAEIPDGVYECAIEEVTSKSKSDTGTEWVSMQMDILDGDNVGQKIFIPYFLVGKNLRDFQIKRSINDLQELVKLYDYELPIEAFADMETLAGNIRTLVGELATVTKTTNKSGYANYKIEKGAF